MKDKVVKLLQRVGGLWLLAALVVLGIEVLSRGLVDTFAFIGGHPMTFVVNVNRMALITVPALFFRKAFFVGALIQLPWLVAAMANRMLMVMRGTPFIWADLQSVGEGASILGDYLTWGIAIEILLFVVVGIGMLVWSFRKHHVPHGKRPLERLAGIALVGVTLLAFQWLCQPDRVMAGEAGNVESAYARNGFLYTFTSDMAKLWGVEEPAEDLVPQEVVEALVGNVQHTGENTSEVRSEGAVVEEKRKPNIIMIQMEAVFDPYLLGEDMYSEDPIPNLHKYMAEGYSGQLGVHTFGGGTARSEFSVLTGMNMDFISDGIPYTDGTVKDQGIETIAHLLRAKGYKTTAIHNHFAHFFDRYKAYSNLGFDTFISKEMMYPVEHEFGWAKDEVLVDYIKRSLSASEQKDFIFGVTVATHGPYDFEHDGLNYGIEIKGDMEEKTKVQFEKYIDRLHHLDKLMGELVSYVEASDEDIILVLYADHGPTLEILKDWTREEKFTTFYTIIDNQKLLPQAQDQYLYDYQLYPKLFELLGTQDGVMNTMHQTYWNSEEYMTYFKGMQQIVLKGLNGLEPTHMTYGLEPVIIQTVEDTPEGLVIKGSGFTEYSKMLVDDKPVETTFISPTQLLVPGQTKGSGEITIGQIGMKDEVLVKISSK